MQFLFGIIGFILGAGLLYWLQNRKQENVQKRLEQARMALKQTEALNRQQVAQIEELQQSQTQVQDLQGYYQKQIEELEQSYKTRIGELEQFPSPNPEPEQEHRQQIEQLQREHKIQIQQTIEELEARYQARIAKIEEAHQRQLDELRQSQESVAPFPSPSPGSEISEPAVAAETAGTSFPVPSPGSEISEPAVAAETIETAGTEEAVPTFNPFLETTPEPLAEFLEDETPSDLDLADLLSAEKEEDFPGIADFHAKTLAGQPPNSDWDFPDILRAEQEAESQLPEELASREQGALTDLFSESENGTNDLQAFLEMLELEEEIPSEQEKTEETLEELLSGGKNGKLENDPSKTTSS